MSRSHVGRVSRELMKKPLGTLGEIAGVQCAVLFSADGFEIASHATDAVASARLAAIGSSLAALGTAISAEAGMRQFDRTTIESPDGTIIIMRIEGNSAMSLAVVAGKNAVLGQLLWATKQCCLALGNVVEK